MRWLLAWVLYWLGDMIERWNDDDRRFTAFGFNAYQRLMAWSDIVQSDGPGPWKPASDTDRNPQGENGEAG